METINVQGGNYKFQDVLINGVNTKCLVPVIVTIKDKLREGLKKITNSETTLRVRSKDTGKVIYGIQLNPGSNRVFSIVYFPNNNPGLILRENELLVGVTEDKVVTRIGGMLGEDDTIEVAHWTNGKC